MSAETPSSADASVLATVTVTFNPDTELLEAQLRALPTTCAKIIVDNASRPDLVERIVEVAHRVPNTTLIRNETNVGLAAAVNRGVEATSRLAMAPKFVLLLDQDSEPEAGSVATLIGAFEALEARGERVGCVGPLLRDPGTGLTHGFHQCTRWRWKRVYPSAGSTVFVPCANLNGSGTLVSLALFRELGGLDESLFIDHVDTEWAFRVIASGYSLWGIPNAVFDHSMGQFSRRFWFLGWKVWPSRSPIRHYYLFRNAVTLVWREYVPIVWKIWALVKLSLTLVVVSITGPSRMDQLRNMALGAWDGVIRHGKV